IRRCSRSRAACPGRCSRSCGAAATTFASSGPTACPPRSPRWASTRGWARSSAGATCAASARSPAGGGGGVGPGPGRALADYHALVRDDRALREELEARFLERMRESDITFGGRVLCPFPRPNLVSGAAYEQIRGVCRGIFRAIEKVDKGLGPELWDRVDLTPEERELVAIDPGYRRASALARLDSFLTPAAYQFVELNAETPAGGAYAE